MATCHLYRGPPFSYPVGDGTKLIFLVRTHRIYVCFLIYHYHLLSVSSQLKDRATDGLGSYLCLLILTTLKLQ